MQARDTNFQNLIDSINLSDDIQYWINEYQKIGHRNNFIWKWTYLNMKELTLSSVPSKKVSGICNDKLLSILINVYVDDIADKFKDRNKLLDASLIINSQPNNMASDPYLKNLNSVWLELLNRIKLYPRYAELKDVFYFDYDQFINANKYSLLINEIPSINNPTENPMYVSHNMQGMVSITMDLMNSPDFDISELGTLRKIAWLAQRMGRIGNSITTWKREIGESDFTSEVFCYLSEKEIIKNTPLEEMSEKEIISLVNKYRIVETLIEKRQHYKNSIISLSKNARSVDVLALVGALDTLFRYHTLSEGLK